ncbi:MAG: TIGR00266 family protein [Chloroflexi bacterium]|nr:TIGR00266 family protein [Chloroflexota bacterium]
MDVQVAERGAFSWVQVHLDPGEQFISEAGAMFRASPNIDIDVTTRNRGGGGFLGGIGRMLAGESFFLSTYASNDGQPGDVGLAPTHQGQIQKIESDGTTDWLCAGGSYLGSSQSLALDTNFQGFRGMLSGESLSFISASGVGTLLVNAFGKISEIDIEGGLAVDSGHVVAFESTLNYSIGKAGGSFLQSFLAGEGLVMNFQGHGRIYVQSHNPDEFGREIGPLLPPRRR